VNRALRAATMGVLLLSPIALTACSAGQVPQTATQNRDKVGPEAAVGDITLRQITLAYPQDGLYSAGDDAELQMAIVNSDTEADTLVGIEGEAFDGVVVSGQATASAVPSSPSAATTPATPSTPGAAPATPTTPGATPSTPTTPGATTSAPTTPGATPSTPTTPGATTSAPTTPGATPVPGTVPTSSAPAAASTQVQIPIPAGSTVFLGGAGGPTVELADLSEELTSGQSIEVTLTFQRAGEVTVPAVVATPGRALPRGEPFDFHEEGEESRDQEQDTETE
jgi:copper(I)-binding protein